MFNNLLQKIKRRIMVVACAHAFPDGAHRTSQEPGSHGQLLASRRPLNKYTHIPLLQGRLWVTSSSTSCTCKDSTFKSHVLVNITRHLRPRYTYTIQFQYIRFVYTTESIEDQDKAYAGMCHCQMQATGTN